MGSPGHVGNMSPPARWLQRAATAEASARACITIAELSTCLFLGPGLAFQTSSDVFFLNRLQLKQSTWPAGGGLCCGGSKASFQLRTQCELIVSGV